VYIGQTGRDLDVRISEHWKAVVDCAPQDSTFAKHVPENGHNFCNAKTSLLHSSQKGKIMNKLEENEILKHILIQ